MSRNHRRHHRKIKSPAIRAAVTESVITHNETTEKLSLQEDGALAAVRHDLWRTAIITGLLLLVLIALSVVNGHHNWTLGFGSTLYRLLHIR